MADRHDESKELSRLVRAPIRPSGLGVLVALCVTLLLLVGLAACGSGDAVPENGETQSTPQAGTAESRDPAGPEPTEEPAEAMSTVAAALAGPPMTVKEYAEACAEEDDPPEDFFMNTPYGELADYWEDIVAWLKDMNPPEELAAYHDALVLDLEWWLAEARSKPRDELPERNSLSGPKELADNYSAARKAVDDATRAVMIAEGCWPPLSY